MAQMKVASPAGRRDVVTIMVRQLLITMPKTQVVSTTAMDELKAGT